MGRMRRGPPGVARSRAPHPGFHCAAGQNVFIAGSPYTPVLCGMAPGESPMILPKGMAKLVPKGSRIAFQIHYTPNGRAQKDRSSIGLVFAKQPPKKMVITEPVFNMLFCIPPRAPKSRSPAPRTPSPKTATSSAACRTCICAAKISWSGPCILRQDRDAPVGTALQFQLAIDLPPGRAVPCPKGARWSASPISITRQKIPVIPIPIAPFSGETRPGRK